jgi:hypothetical protein
MDEHHWSALISRHADDVEVKENLGLEGPFLQ